MNTMLNKISEDEAERMRLEALEKRAAQELPGVEKILFSLAQKTSKTCPVTYQEALSECYFAYMCACRDWDPFYQKKGRNSKFSSWVYFWTWTHLKTWITKRTNDRLVFFDSPGDEEDGVLPYWIENIPAPPQHSPCLELIEDLSQDARELVKLILEMPSDLKKDMWMTKGDDWTIVPPERILEKVVNHMVRQLDHEEDNIEWAVAECMSKFRAVWAN